MKTPRRTSISRRQFNQTAALTGAGAMLLPLLAKSAAASVVSGGLGRRARAPSSDDESPHFFLQIVVTGGADASCLFDARPLEMTAAGKIHNYFGEEPTAWDGVNGGRALVTRSARALAPYRGDFSVLNGVVMATTFDGHTQNLNYLFAGNPFGGDAYVPLLNRRALAGAAKPSPIRPLDALQQGFFDAQLSGTESVVPLSPDSAATLIDRLKSSAALDPANAVYRFIASRYAALGGGPGSFSSGSRNLGTAFALTPDLSRMLLAIRQPPASVKGLEGLPKALASDRRFIQLCLELFKAGAMTSSILSLTDYGPVEIDTHDGDSARKQPQTYADIAERLAAVFKLLKETPFDATRSFLDVTTVAYNTEFSRTMRQTDKAIDATGTDHNPLTNSVLLAGKGIRGGLVVGASDFATSTEKLSAAHVALDSNKVKSMGRPFDFAKLAPRADLPAALVLTDYLTIGSVVNTLFDLYAAPKAAYRTLDRVGTLAPSLNGLLT